MRCQNGHENRADAAFCIECGAQLVRACERCARELPPTARFCDGCGAPVTAAAQRDTLPYAPPPHLAAKILRDRATIEGERRNVTVLFIDAVGSTSKSENVDPEEVHRLVRHCTDLMIDAVNQFEGAVTQFRGDGVMALFGAPIAHEDSARRAVAAAVAMRDTLTAYALEREAAGKLAFRYRIGLNTGPVVVGAVGSDLTMDYTAIGDTVNLAARMEQWASPNSIYLTESTERAVGAYFELRDLGQLEVKGRAETVQTYEVLRELPSRSRLDASAERGLTPYVGRAEQLDLLRASIEQAGRGEGQVVFVTGEAGMGKSRLLLEFRRSLEGQAAWLEGRCISWGRNFPYLPIVDVVRHNFGIEEAEDDAATIGKVQEGVAAWDSAGQQAAPYLRFLLNVDPGDDSVLSMDGIERRARLLDALRTMLLEESRRMPLVIAIEDLHWIDEQSEEALAALIDAVASIPALFIITCRPGYTHMLGDRTYYSRLALANLPPEECVAMVQGVLQASGVPESLCQIIVTKAEGNPFYIEEVSRSLVESGVLRRRDGALELARPVEQVNIPDTIQEVILSRLDRLQLRAREAVQYASVIGREFPVRLLKHVAVAETQMDELLGELKTLELIYEKSYFPELEYMFKHALTQEVALSTLLADRRRSLHREVAGAIEELYADHLPEQYEALAYHCYQAEDWLKALDYERRVAERAARLHAPRAAIDHATRAIDAQMQLGDRRDPALYRLRGLAYEAVGEFERAREDHEAAIKAARAADDARGEWQANCDLGMLWAGRDYSRTGTYFQRAHEIAREAGDPSGIATTLNRLGNWRLNNTDQPLEALADHHEALRIFESLEDKHGMAESLDFLAMTSALSGDLTAAVEFGIKAEALFRELGDKQRLAGLLPTIGFCSRNIDTMTLVPVTLDRPSPHAAIEEAIQISRDIGWRAGEAYALTQRSLALAAVGRYSDALEMGHAALIISEQIGHDQWKASSYSVIACSYGDLLQYGEATQWLQRSLETAEAIGSRHWIGCSGGYLAIQKADGGDPAAAEEVLERWARPDLPMISIGQRMLWLGRGVTQAARGDQEAALDTYNKLGESAVRNNGRGIEAIPLIAWRAARSHHALGNNEEALRLLTVSLENLVDIEKMLPYEWRVIGTMGDVYSALGRNDDATTAYARANEILDEIAGNLRDAGLRERFLNAPEVVVIRNGAAPARAL